MGQPSQLTFHNFAYALDGGSTILSATDEMGREHTITLVQYVFTEQSPTERAIPGRLYFNDELVPMRSAVEFRILELLRKATIAYSEPRTASDERIQDGPQTVILGSDIRDVLTRDANENMRAMVAGIISFVESDDYLAFAEQMRQAQDTTRYSVWVDCESAGRKRAMVRLARVLGIGLNAARDFLDRGTPLAESVSALEVIQIARRYSEDGLDVRIEPPFKWPVAATEQRH